MRRYLTLKKYFSHFVILIFQTFKQNRIKKIELKYRMARQIRDKVVVLNQGKGNVFVLSEPSEKSIMLFILNR